ncbi:hypothetical protein [Verrucomicrobium spinosum]|uniref:hypothetical protein n=1 Tax=Verrucomicrobium spinosum TaxID=2736 RepID=UPI0009462DB0|nr:hypothetical protein [Verrucomicrobium spinosum]
MPEDEDGNVYFLCPGQSGIDSSLGGAGGWEGPVFPHQRVEAHLAPTALLNGGDDLKRELSLLGHIARAGDEDAQGSHGAAGFFVRWQVTSS